MNYKLIFDKLESIENMLKEQNILKRDVLNITDAVKYMDISYSHLYKLTSRNIIPYYKPGGKKIYFNRKELDTWLLSNRSSSNDEIEQEAADYLMTKRRKHK